MISASSDKTLKAWDLATYTCRITHRGDASYFAVRATTVIAGDHAGGVWFLDWRPMSVEEAPGVTSAATTD